MTQWPEIELGRMVEDDGVTLASMQAYARLARRYGSAWLEQPCPAKELWLATAMGVHRDTVRASLLWLIDHGYIVESGRGMNNVRMVRATWHPKATTTMAA